MAYTIRDALKDIADAILGAYKADDAAGRFEDYDNALKAKGYGCATEEEWNKHKELFAKKIREEGGILPNNNPFAPDGADVAELGALVIAYRHYEFQRGREKINSKCKARPMHDARDKFKQSQNKSSPIILDLDGDGVETTKVNQGTWFDHDGNGYAESTGWVGKDDGLLVRDVDGSGYIDAGSELFGNNTKLSNGKLAANGFEALKDLDAVANGGNADGKVDSNDAAWASLKIWKDANGDGYHSDGEVISLAEAGVRSLNVAYINSTQVDANGNAHQQLGSFTKTDGTTGKATDVWFAVDKMNTIAEDWLEVPDDIAAMPDMLGFGNVHSLQKTMVRDAANDGENEARDWRIVA